MPERAPTERCKYRYSWEMQRAKLGTPQYATPWGLSRHRRLADPERDTRDRGGARGQHRSHVPITHPCLVPSPCPSPVALGGHLL